MEASALLPDWQHFASALQIVRPSQQLEFESVLPTKRWVDIGGYEAIKQALQRFIRLATLDAPLQLGIVPPSGVLLHGPSGCGKTALALAMIGESSCNVITIRGSELFSKYLGETEARLRRLFRTARAAAPCIVFMDEIDSIAAKREWSSVESGRFDQLIEVRMPSPADRAGILQVLSGKSRLADDVSVSELVEKTDGFSGSDLEQLFREAGLSALRACCHAEILCKSDFASALDKLQTQRLNWLV
ncbi:hypothetical protein H4R26_000907 [Coemansia thaxteri]|uniref:AAA+ ATPase domain-containing protein n=1 Tax=Coemansia thaxteri TaxID=2663907 RepID=A0A9W8BNY9_9FUNG|nr:hypothetical protein H4R26_000907 [Coemansia thaxteri]